MKKISSKYRKKRIIFIASIFLICSSALIFIISNFRDNIIFFYSPSELDATKIADQKIIRVGGMIKKGSVKYLPDSILEFVITDFDYDLKIHYQGIKPNLFREGQGMVAKGIWNKKDNIFIAGELLTKHDEKYMPPEIAKKIQN